MSRGLDYLISGRLQDVLALIQVLGLHSATYRTENALRNELKVEPISADSWVEVAQNHPEFFRVSGESKNVSLVARHVSKSEDGNHKLEVPFVQMLMQTAVSMHDLQYRRKQDGIGHSRMRKQQIRHNLRLIFTIVGGLGTLLISLTFLFFGLGPVRR